MDNFTQILRRLPTNDAYSSGNHSRGATPFKVQFNFEIFIFKGQIYVNVIYRWLNMFEGYFSIHDFSNRENITFSLLKATPHVKDWWETYCEKKDEGEAYLFSTIPTWNSFQDTIKEQYYPMGSYEDKYI